jgi:hypothetical protein
VGISRDYPRKTRTSKQPIGEIPGYEIIPSHPLKYPRSKQGLRDASGSGFLCLTKPHYIYMMRPASVHPLPPKLKDIMR